MPPIFQAAILGIVQGLTEFLPVSSTAHLLIGSRLLGYQDPGGVFVVMIQLGSILAIMWLYRAKIVGVVAGLATRRESQLFALNVFVAFLPALVAGAFLAKYVKAVLYNSMTVIAAAFIIGGIVMLIVERFRPTSTVHDVDRTSAPQALAIGIGQVLALIPGVSRSGATMVAGMLVGLDRPTAAEFSFFVAMPTMSAAFVHDLLEVRSGIPVERALEIAIGFVMAFIASLVVVKPFLGIVRRVGFAPFAAYRVIIGFGLLAAIAAGWL
jgi:undecaprenyl-diphosphatase